MQSMYYIGLDVHKKTISYCVKDVSGSIQAEGSIHATRPDLDHWMKTLPQPWTAAMEATVFTGWIYDHLKPHAAALKVAHPLMLRAIAAGKKKNDRIDAKKICDCLRCDFLPECYMAPTAIRERRRRRRTGTVPGFADHRRIYPAGTSKQQSTQRVVFGPKDNIHPAAQFPDNAEVRNHGPGQLLLFIMAPLVFVPRQTLAATSTAGDSSPIRLRHKERHFFMEGFVPRRKLLQGTSCARFG